jgi:hypothetical protein
VLALADDLKSRFLERSHCLQVVDAWQPRHTS